MKHTRTNGAVSQTPGSNGGLILRGTDYNDNDLEAWNNTREWDKERKPQRGSTDWEPPAASPSAERMSPSTACPSGVA